MQGLSMITQGPEGSSKQKITEKPWVFFMICILIANTDNIVSWIIPDLEKYFVTKEQFVTVEENIKSLNVSIDEIKKILEKQTDKQNEQRLKGTS